MMVLVNSCFHQEVPQMAVDVSEHKMYEDVGQSVNFTTLLLKPQRS